MLVGDYGEIGGDRALEFIGPQKKIGVARPAEALVPGREGLVKQEPARRRQPENIRHDRPPEIVGHDDARKGPAGERKIRRLFEVERQYFHPGNPLEIREFRDVDIDESHRMSPRQEQPAVPAAAAGEIEHRLFGSHFGCESDNPLRRWVHIKSLK